MQQRVLRFLVILFAVVLGGWVLGGALNLLAILSPQMVSKIDCPAGSVARMHWAQRSVDQPGQQTLGIACLDPSGNPVSSLTDAQSRALEYRYFFPTGVVVMVLIVLGWQVLWSVRRTPVAKTSS